MWEGDKSTQAWLLGCLSGLLTLVGARQADYKAQGDDSWSMSGKKILLLPTVVINGNQYRGRLDVPAVTRALCAGFSETTEPSVRGRCAAWQFLVVM